MSSHLRAAAACMTMAAVLLGGRPGPALAQNVTNAPPAAASPTTPQLQPVAPNAGAAGDSAAGASSVPPAGRRAPGSDNGGQLAGSDVPGGRNHAPAEAAPAQSFSAPIKKD